MKAYERTGNIVSRKIAGELFLVPISGGLADMQRMFALTTVGEFIWESLDGKRSLSDIRTAVVGRFRVGEPQADADVREFVAELLAAGLVREATG